MKANRIIKKIVAVVLIFILSTTGVSAANGLTAPDWITVQLNADYSKTLILTTPTYMLSHIEYYEYSTDGFLTSKILSEPAGGEFIISETCQFSIRYYSNGIPSPEYSMQISINKNTVINCPSTNISIVISQFSSIPETIKISAFEIIGGNDYTKAKNAMDGLSFSLYYVSVTNGNTAFESEEPFSYLFPSGDFDVRFCKLYSLDESGNATHIETTTELNMLNANTTKTGMFIVAEDRRYSTGDMNGDGLVQAKDARTALRIAALLENFTEIQLNAGDINKNGKIDASDARKILRFASKLDII